MSVCIYECVCVCVWCACSLGDFSTQKSFKCHFTLIRLKSSAGTCEAWGTNVNLSLDWAGIPTSVWNWIWLHTSISLVWRKFALNQNVGELPLTHNRCWEIVWCVYVCACVCVYCTIQEYCHRHHGCMNALIERKQWIKNEFSVCTRAWVYECVLTWHDKLSVLILCLMRFWRVQAMNKNPLKLCDVNTC